MADPLSTTASIIALVQLSAEVIKYISATTGAKKERKELRSEIWACEAILQQLQHESADIEEGDEWEQTLRTLKGPDAPLRQLFNVLGLIKAKLLPEKGLRAALRWPFEAKEIEKLIVTLERQKVLLQIALTNDCRYVNTN